jgi:FdhE protein
MDLHAITRTPQERERLHQEAERRWAQLEREQPNLADTITFGRGLVALYIDDLPAAARVNLSPEAAQEKLAAGLPLLEDEEIDLDLPGIRHFFFRLCSWAGQQPDLAPGGDRLQRAMMAEELSVSDLLGVALAGDRAAIDALADRLGVEPIMVQTLTGFTVSAALMGTARVLAPLAAQANVTWTIPNCPICGGQPLFAELHEAGSVRLLRCAACGIAWGVPVESCIHCGNEDQQTLHHISMESHGLAHRVDLCDRCHGYLKVAIAPSPTPPELLTIQDAALLHLDAISQQHGYTPTPDVTDDE